MGDGTHSAGGGGRLRFRRFGGQHHLVLETAEDLAGLGQLDEAHWVAVGAPTETLDTDPVFLKLVDLDKDGRIRPFEVLAAVDWALARLLDTSGLEAGDETLALAAIETDSDEGRELVATARKVLGQLKTQGDSVSLQQVREAMKLEEREPVSEAGVVLPHAAGDDDLTRQLIEDIIRALGGVPHPTGAKGVDAPLLDRFVKEANAFVTWFESGRAAPADPSKAILPFGEETLSLYADLAAVQPKIEQYFGQCRALALGLPAVAPAELPDLNDPASVDRALEAAPLAPPAGDRLLDLDGEINIVWAERVRAFRAGPLARVAGAPQEIDEDQWRAVVATFAAHARWNAARPDVAAATLGYERLVWNLGDEGLAKLRLLIDRSSRTALTMGRIRKLERLVLFQAHLLQLANNYVSFPDLYTEGERALFDVGNLIMDGRHFNLAVRVRDRKAHVALASKSNLCVLYVQVKGDGEDAYEVAVAVTAGGRGNLSVGKRGMFVDTRGRESAAQVVQMVSNPISFREAVTAPFRRLQEALAGRLEAVTRSAEEEVDQAGQAAVTAAADGTKTALTTDQPSDSKAEPAKADSKKPEPGSGSGVLAGGGIALAALGSSVVYILDTLAEMSWLTIGTGIGVALLLVLVPATLLALIKLNNRDLSTILEGSGWAINVRMGLTRKQARTFTERPKYPASARGVFPPWRKSRKRRVPPPTRGGGAPAPAVRDDGRS